MKIQRVILLVCLFVIANAGLFGKDAKTERKSSRVAAERKQKTEEDRFTKRAERDDKKDQKKQARQQKNGPAPDEVLLESDIAEILDDTTIIDTVTLEDDIKLKNDEIYKMWEKNMHDFVPEDLTNFIVDASSAAVLYETIGHTNPTLVKGAYYVHGGPDARPINVFVQDPDKAIIYKRSGEIQGIILFNTTIPGEYSFIFSNLDDNLDKTTTLAIHTYEDKLDPIQYDITDRGETVVKFDPKKKEREDDLKEELELAGDEEIGSVRNLLRLIQTHAK